VPTFRNKYILELNRIEIVESIRVFGQAKQSPKILATSITEYKIILR